MKESFGMHTIVKYSLCLITFNLQFSASLFAQLKVNEVANTTAIKAVIQNTDETIDTTKLYKVEKHYLKTYSIPEVRITNFTSEPIQSKLDFKKQDFPTTFQPSIKLGMERKQALAYVFIPQYIRKADGTYEKLRSIEYKIVEGKATANKTAGTRAYATSSVLASGKWYKIALNTTGIYKITGDYIQNELGVSLATINPANIRLYGNGGAMLSEDNSVERADDLVENAIKVVDGGDGQMNTNDYILFYATSPHATINDSVNKKFTHLDQLYSEQSCYFLNFDLGPGKRVVLGSNPSTSTVNVTSFDDFQFYEKDSVNLGKFGKTWWGTQFSNGLGGVLNRIFTFNFSNIETTSPVRITTRSGTAGSYSGISGMNISANGQVIQTIQYEPYNNGAYWQIPTIISKLTNTNATITSPSLSLAYNYSKGSEAAVGYIDFIEVNARRKLIFNGYLNFADWNSLGASQIANYTIENVNSNTEVWDITNPLLPQRMNTTLNGNVLNFNQDANILHRFIAFDGSVVNIPLKIGLIENQNLHNYTPIDYLVIAHPSFIGEANRLAAHHASKRNYKTKVVSTLEIYNEFSSGIQDISAIRDYVKMLYDRAPSNQLPHDILLFGDASYDYKDRINNNTNFVPVSETDESEDRITGYCTDDFFGFLDDSENPNEFGIVNTLDVGIGRMPVSSQSSASDVVNKVILYDSPASFGPWKNNITFNADDGDGAGHLDSSEKLADVIRDSLPNFNVSKIYLDGFVEQSTPAGTRSPDANNALKAQIFNGTFLMNYNGHGGPTNWCDERIFSLNDINSLNNKTKLPLFITATCDFAPFDNPALISAGELLFLKPNGGAIAMMTTTQLVFATENAIMNGDYIKNGFKPMSNGEYPTLGDAYRISKNFTYSGTLSKNFAANFRKFALLGDAGLPLSFPKHRVVTDSVNGKSVNVQIDTLKAQAKYTITGHITDKQGIVLNNFNGTIYPTIFDKSRKLATLGNGSDNPKREYEIQNNAIYKGKASVKNGKFSYSFVVPKDINYQIALGKISYYAENQIEDANGFSNQIYIGGSSNTGIQDNAGPTIKAYLNDEKFVNGGIVNANSILLLKLFDDNGINYTGNSIGHDITAILDNNTQNIYVLNNFFEADMDSYQSGSVKFPLNGLTEGKHTLTIKAWDVMNNSKEVMLDFEVVSSSDAKLSHVYNYPNPFTTKTEFMFEHNLPNQNLFVTIQVYSITGKVVKQIRTSVNTPGTRVTGIDWDGRDEYGDKIGKGVYFYKLAVKSDRGLSESVLQKLVVL